MFRNFLINFFTKNPLLSNMYSLFLQVYIKLSKYAFYNKQKTVDYHQRSKCCCSTFQHLVTTSFWRNCCFKEHVFTWFIVFVHAERRKRTLPYNWRKRHSAIQNFSDNRHTVSIYIFYIVSIHSYLPAKQHRSTGENYL